MLVQRILSSIFFTICLISAPTAFAQTFLTCKSGLAHGRPSSQLEVRDLPLTPDATGMISFADLKTWNKASYESHVDQTLKYELPSGPNGALSPLGPMTLRTASSLGVGRAELIHELREQSRDPNLLRAGVESWVAERLRRNRDLVHQIEKIGGFEEGNPEHEAMRRNYLDESSIRKNLENEILGGGAVEVGRWVMTLKDGRVVSSPIFTDYSPFELFIERPLWITLEQNKIPLEQVLQLELYHTHSETPLLSAGDREGTLEVANKFVAKGYKPRIHIFAIGGLTRITSGESLAHLVGHFGMQP